MLDVAPSDDSQSMPIGRQESCQAVDFKNSDKYVFEKYKFSLWAYNLDSESVLINELKFLRLKCITMEDPSTGEDNVILESCKVEPGEKLDTESDRNFYDIAIVGGGMVGMAFAGALLEALGCVNVKPPVQCASMQLTKQLNVAIIDSNPALSSGLNIKKDDPPDPRVSTVTPATISLFNGISLISVIFSAPSNFPPC
ncbi:putative ubiquinone biosynthesis monooxygenase [Asimina triloba]